MKLKINQLFIGNYSAEQLVAQFGSPLYVYDEEVIRNQIRKLKNAFVYPGVKFYYACKANTNLAILKIVLEEGCFLDAVSLGEVYAALKAGFSADKIRFTGVNVSNEEFSWLIEKKIAVNLGSLSEVERYGKLNPGKKISVRINTNVGAGHHSHVITGGESSKFGIYFLEIAQLFSVCKKYDLKIVGIHHHIGSGILDYKIFLHAMDILLEIADQFFDLEFIDFGGGFGIPYQKNQKELNISFLGKKIVKKFNSFCNSYGKKLSFHFEPGRYFVAQSGSLLCTVNTIKKTPKYTFVGVNTGFNHLIRPAMYGSFHEVVNCSNPQGKLNKYLVAGNICESGDIFTRDENGIKEQGIAELHEGDVLAILNSGAYGMSMASHYNLQQLPVEVLIQGKDVRIIRKREEFSDFI